MAEITINESTYKVANKDIQQMKVIQCIYESQIALDLIDGKEATKPFKEWVNECKFDVPTFVKLE